MSGLLLEVRYARLTDIPVFSPNRLKRKSDEPTASRNLASPREENRVNNVQPTQSNHTVSDQDATSASSVCSYPSPPTPSSQAGHRAPTSAAASASVASPAIQRTVQQRKKAKLNAQPAAAIRSYVFGPVPVFPFISGVIFPSDSPQKKFALQFTVDHIKHPFATVQERADAAAAAGCQVVEFDQAMNNYRMKDRCGAVIRALFAGHLNQSAQADPRHALHLGWDAPFTGANPEKLRCKSDGAQRREARRVFEEQQRKWGIVGAAEAVSEPGPTPNRTPRAQQPHSAPRNSTYHFGMHPHSARNLDFDLLLASGQPDASQPTADSHQSDLASEDTLPLLDSPDLTAFSPLPSSYNLDSSHSDPLVSQGQHRSHTPPPMTLDRDSGAASVQMQMEEATLAEGLLPGMADFRGVEFPGLTTAHEWDSEVHAGVRGWMSADDVWRLRCGGWICTGLTCGCVNAEGTTQCQNCGVERNDGGFGPDRDPNVGRRDDFAGGGNGGGDLQAICV